MRKLLVISTILIVFILGAASISLADDYYYIVPPGYVQHRYVYDPPVYIERERKVYYVDPDDYEVEHYYYIDPDDDIEYRYIVEPDGDVRYFYYYDD
jgi:hypothetical protein